jgi:hypothetical protein
MRKTMAALLVFCGATALSGQSSTAQTAVVTLSVAQLRDLRDTPVVLVAAPGAGLAISPVSVTLQYNFGTQNYPGGHGRLITTLGPYATDQPISAFDDVLTAGFLDRDSNQTITLQADPIDPSLDVTNLDLEIINFGPPLVDGDGSVTVTVNYNIVSTQ